MKDKIILAKRGDKKALQEIILKFTPFVIKTANRTYIKGCTTEDLIQIGKVSIMKSVDMFDVNREGGFASYVMSAITRNFYNLIRCTVKEGNCCSLNSIIDGGAELIDLIPSKENLEEEFEKKEEIMFLKKALDKLSLKEKEIIYWFYFENKTLNDYAKAKGICYRTAVNRKKKVLDKLRRKFHGYL